MDSSHAEIIILPPRVSLAVRPSFGQCSPTQPRHLVTESPPKERRNCRFPQKEQATGVAVRGHCNKCQSRSVTNYRPRLGGVSRLASRSGQAPRVTRAPVTYCCQVRDCGKSKRPDKLLPSPISPSKAKAAFFTTVATLESSATLHPLIALVIDAVSY